MDSTPQTIDEIRGSYTDLVDELHEKGAINEGQLKELLDLGMALAKPNLTASGRLSVPELVEEHAELMEANAGIARLEEKCIELMDHNMEFMKDNKMLREAHKLQLEDNKWEKRMIFKLLDIIDAQDKQITELGAVPQFAAGRVRADLDTFWRRHLGRTRPGRTRSGRPFRR